MDELNKKLAQEFPSAAQATKSSVDSSIVEAQKTISSSTGKMKTDAETNLAGVKKAAEDASVGVNTTTVTNWGNSASEVKKNLDKMKQTANLKLGEMQKTVESHFSGQYNTMTKKWEKACERISSYKSGNGQSYRKFYMNRDGFSLLAMGFTGREALEWKLQYIRAFNQMENFIREKSTQMWIETRKAGKLTRKAETDTIQKLVEYAKGQGSSHAEMLYMTYSRLANKMAGINKRDEATVMQLNNLSLMENIILHEVDLGIMQGKYYQEIYRDCKKRLEAVKDLAYLEAV